jgi:hypothetical protein
VKETEPFWRKYESQKQQQHYGSENQGQKKMRIQKDAIEMRRPPVTVLFYVVTHETLALNPPEE